MKDNLVYDRVHDLGRPRQLVVVITVLIPYSNSQTAEVLKQGQGSRLLDEYCEGGSGGFLMLSPFLTYHQQNLGADTFKYFFLVLVKPRCQLTSSEVAVM